MKKSIITYLAKGAGLLLLTGLLAMFLGMGNLFKEETDKYITEIFSSFMGSIYLAFLAGRLRQKEWEEKRTKKECAFYAAMGLGLFAARTFSRLVWLWMNYLGRPGLGYVLCILADLLAIAGIYFLMPADKKEVFPNA